MRLTEDEEQVNPVLPPFEHRRRSIVACIKSGDFDFIGVAITPWHARIAVASYLKLRSSRLVDTGILLIDRHNKDGYLITPETIAPGLKVTYLERGSDSVASMARAFICRMVLPSLQAKKKSGRLVYIANPSFPGSIFDSFAALTLDCRFSYILLDEGVGSYLSSAKDWAEQSIRDRGLHGPSAIMRSWLFIHEQRQIPKLIRELEENNRFEKYYLFKDDGSLNANNAEFVKKSFALNSKNAESSTHLINEKYKGSVVFCSQFPLVEAGSISLDAHLKAVKASYQVSKRLGVRLVIKTHPRENDITLYNGFDAYIDSRRGVALEDILGDLDMPPLCIASLCSTAMITAAAVFNCHGIGLNKLISDEDASDSFVIFCDRLSSLFGRYYKSPSSIDELYSFLEFSN